MIIRNVLVATAIGAIAFILEGCDSTLHTNAKDCKIADIYPMLQVNGRVGYSKSALDDAGIRLCARHAARMETYQGLDACSKPDEVFPGGHLPDIMVGDSQAMLLVKCPSSEYPNDHNLQRIICSMDLSFDANNGEEHQVPTVRFDSDRAAANCVINATIQANGTAPIVPHDAVNSDRNPFQSSWDDMGDLAGYSDGISQDSLYGASPLPFDPANPLNPAVQRARAGKAAEKAILPATRSP